MTIQTNPANLFETRPISVLYIDDDAINRALIVRLLSQFNCQVAEADSGLEGIRLAKQNPPDLILMDINMPGLDGHETTTKMRTITGLKNTPIVAITANTTPEDRELALTAGCSGYINKPIDIDKFPGQIAAYLEGRKDTVSKDKQQHYLGQYSQKLVERLESKIIELQKANVQLQRVDKLKTDFITVAAHELRTPMTLVYGYARLLQSAVQDRYDYTGTLLPQEQISDEQDQIGQLVDKIYHSVHRLNDVVGDILNVFNLEAKSLQLQQGQIHLDKVITAALSSLDPANNGRKLTISLENLENLPPITGDAERLKQVFWNLLSNAIKFTPDNGQIWVSGWVGSPESTTGSQDEQVILYVKDTGIGLDPADQTNIFDQFYMVNDPSYHSTSKTAFGGGGIGLGLSIAKGIIEAHGGRIWAESQGRRAEQPGTTFYVLLPVNPPAQSPIITEQ